MKTSLVSSNSPENWTKFINFQMRLAFQIKAIFILKQILTSPTTWVGKRWPAGHIQPMRSIYVAYKYSHVALSICTVSGILW